MKTGDIIKALIKSKGLRQVDFCNTLGLSVQAFRMQIDRPSYPTLEKYAKALDVPMWRLLATEKEVCDYLVGKECKKANNEKGSNFLATITCDNLSTSFDNFDEFKQFVSEM